jgi:GNAT superfamily N-acetyltransferase
MITDWNPALDVVKKVLAADFACEESYFDKEGIIITRARKMPGRRRFPFPKKYLAMATMGRGVVICCSAERLRWAKDNLVGLSRDSIFSSNVISHLQQYVFRDQQNMHLYIAFVCTQESFKPFTSNQDIEIITPEDEKLSELQRMDSFPNSIGHAENPERPRVIIAANYRGKIIGMAAAAADSDPMWQIGVDTLPEYRNLGIAKSTVSVVTKIVLDKGILPYYSTRIVNIASQRTALSLGYHPAWVEIYSRDIYRDTPHPEDPII